MTAAKPRCPECSKPFATVQLLSMHRRQAHGVVGMSKSAIAERARKAKQPPAPTTPLPGQALILGGGGTTFPCPRCDQSFTSLNGLAKHQSKMHGIVGQSKSARERHAKKMKQAAAAPPPPPQPLSHVCDQCGFTAKTKAGLSIHIGTRHKRSNALATIAREENATTAATAANGHGQIQPHRDGIAEATLALALGRFQGLCQSMAAEFDLPPKRFAAQLAALIYASQIR